MLEFDLCAAAGRMLGRFAFVVDAGAGRRQPQGRPML
jgi:hypothetical protein